MSVLKRTGGGRAHAQLLDVRSIAVAVLKRELPLPGIKHLAYLAVAVLGLRICRRRRIRTLQAALAPRFNHIPSRRSVQKRAARLGP